MNAFLWNVVSVIPGIASMLLDFRFLSRTLGRKFSALKTFAALGLFKILYGNLNVTLELAGTILTNELYFCLGNLLLALTLFKGSMWKKAIMTALLSISPGALRYILLPLDFAYVSANGQWSGQAPAVLAISYLSVICTGAALEFTGRKFQKLYYDLPAGYGAYLVLTGSFAYAACVVVTDLALFYGGDKALFPAAVFCSLFSLAGTAVVVLAISAVDNQIATRLAQQRYALQSAGFKSREADWKQAARLRHDLKNHLLCLSGLLREGKNEQALHYLEQLEAVSFQNERRIGTGNEYADVILNEKCAEAKSRGIAFSADLALPAKCAVDPVDLCCIFSNTLDNAIAACSRLELPGAERWITVRAFVKQSQLIIEIKNSAGGPEDPSHRKQGHGIGLESVRAAIGNYHGVMDLSAEGDSFTFRAMLPLD